MNLFRQPAPTLGNQYNDDDLLKRYLRTTLPPEVLRDIEPSLQEMGELSGGELYLKQQEDRLSEPRLISWDAWGNRIDRIEMTPLWQRAERLAAEKGVVATAYERRHGRFSRIHQFALAYLFHPSTDVYTCPLAMTDGAAKTLHISGNKVLQERALPHLTSRDPAQFWTSGQWMTELPGGSDVGLTETQARRDSSAPANPQQTEVHARDRWTLHGRKWFTSAAASPMALALARPEGNGPGGSGLALFYVETRDEAGRLQGIEVARLKDKLGTRKLPTAEIYLHGTPARLVMGERDGVKNIAPMLNITRTWNAVTSAAFMRRALALVENYSKKRFAFGAMISEKPLHRATLAEMRADFEGAFVLAFYLAELLGREECGELSADQAILLRLLTSVGKATAGKQAVRIVSEAVECFGGAGYVEDTGIPALLRDTQVLSIWEGTTNVLALDALKTLTRENAWPIFREEVLRILPPGHAREPAIRERLDWQQRFLESGKNDPTALEAGARRLTLSLGETLQSALLARLAAPPR